MGRGDEIERYTHTLHIALYLIEVRDIRHWSLAETMNTFKNV